ncbi:MAG: hypothetical protein WDO14_05610 [Bacteroidota bacterium]
MVNITTTYPLLTMEKLKFLELKIERNQTVIEDVELIDHYVSSAVYPGSLLEDIRDERVSSFEEFIFLLRSYNYDDKKLAAKISGVLLGNIHGLMECLQRGEKIY